MTGEFIITTRPRADRCTERGNTFFWHAKREAEQRLESDGLPIVQTGSVAVKIALVYPQPGTMPDHLQDSLEHWGEHGIPRPERAAALILDALAGSLYSSVSQVEPLHVSRVILPATKLLEQYGPEHRTGLTIVRWSCD